MNLETTMTGALLKGEAVWLWIVIGFCSWIPGFKI